MYIIFNKYSIIIKTFSMFPIGHDELFLHAYVLIVFKRLINIIYINLHM